MCASQTHPSLFWTVRLSDRLLAVGYGSDRKPCLVSMTHFMAKTSVRQDAAPP